jgi:RNA polymerase sigma factor (TIGR02999 family)
MRRVLIDHANERNAAKRGGGGERVELADDLAGPEVDLDSLLELNAALERLEAVSPRQAKAVELRFFAGLTLTEAAEVLGTSAPTVMRDLRFAQAWLARELGRAPGGRPADDR